MMVDVRIIEHDLAAATQAATAVRFALHEAIDEFPVQVAGTRALGQGKAGVADRFIDAIDVECVLHHGMTDSVAATGAGSVAKKHDLRLRQLDTRRARGNGWLDA